MIIPKRFQLAGFTIEVERDDTFVEKHNCVGQCFYTPEQKIVLDHKAGSQQFTEQAFWHECLHWCFYIMGEHELRNNEKFVDMLAHFVYQIHRQLIDDDNANIE